MKNRGFKFEAQQMENLPSFTRYSLNPPLPLLFGPSAETIAANL
jgi:hypothetical protein